MKRFVLFHFHLFKNAGTSVDRVLRESFGDSWLSREFSSTPAPIRRAEVEGWISSNPSARAFSSHTAELPPPEVADVTVFPIVFVRHPLDRIASVYEFERQQSADQTIGSVLARHTDLEGYFKVRWALPDDRQCENFHVERLSAMLPEEYGTEFQRAGAALQALPFVGLVEEFEKSIEYLADLVSYELPEFKAISVAENVTRNAAMPLADKLDELRRRLGETSYRLLEQRNAADLELYAQATKLAREAWG